MDKYARISFGGGGDDADTRSTSCLNAACGTVRHLGLTRCLPRNCSYIATPSIGSCDVKRAASDEKTRVSLARVTRDAAPEQMQQIEIAVLNMHACPAQLDHF